MQAEKEKVDIRLYRVIYQAIEDINAARVGLLSPDIVEEDTGIAEVRETFKVPKVGTIAGCYITEGEINRDDKVRIVRDGTVIFEGVIESLRRFKDDVKSVQPGLRVRHRHPRLPGPQGGRYHRGLPGEGSRANGVTVRNRYDHRSARRPSRDTLDATGAFFAQPPTV